MMPIRRTAASKFARPPIQRLVPVFALVLGTMAASPARADLRVCNATSSRIGIAIGYRDAKGWATEGWWNIAPQSCENMLNGPMPSRYIYVHAVDYDRGGEWAGGSFMCTSDRTFMIRGVHDCQKRNYERTGFFEVDTGESREWTIRLADPEE
jgi:uncharacterized membrane protein